MNNADTKSEDTTELEKFLAPSDLQQPEGEKPSNEIGKAKIEETNKNVRIDGKEQRVMKPVVKNAKVDVKKKAKSKRELKASSKGKTRDAEIKKALKADPAREQAKDEADEKADYSTIRRVSSSQPSLRHIRSTSIAEKETLLQRLTSQISLLQEKLDEKASIGEVKDFKKAQLVLEHVKGEMLKGDASNVIVNHTRNARIEHARRKRHTAKRQIKSSIETINASKLKIQRKPHSWIIDWMLLTISSG